MAKLILDSLCFKLMQFCKHYYLIKATVMNYQNISNICVLCNRVSIKAHRSMLTLLWTMSRGP